MLPTRPASPPPADYTLFDLGSTAETADILARPYLHEFLTAAYQDYDVSLSAFALLQQDFYFSAGQCPCSVAMCTLAFFLSLLESTPVCLLGQLGAPYACSLVAVQSTLFSLPGWGAAASRL